MKNTQDDAIDHSHRASPRHPTRSAP